MENKDMHQYYWALRHKLDCSLLWDSLQDKTDYGAAEKGYQSIAMYTAANLAMDLDCDDTLTEVLFICLGSIFPTGGEAGLACVIDYMKEKGLYTSTNDLAVNYIEYRLEIDGNIGWEYDGHVIEPQFDALLHELFSDNVSTMEVKIAKLCQDMIKKIKIIENNSDKNRHDLLKQIPQEIEKATKENHMLTNSPTLEKLYNNLTTINKPSLTLAQYHECISLLDEFSDNGNNIEGIYEYMSFGFDIG